MTIHMTNIPAAPLVLVIWTMDTYLFLMVVRRRRPVQCTFWASG